MGERDDIRQRRLRELLKDQFKGVQRDLAEAIERDANYVSRMLSTGPNRKGIGEDVARDIEVKLQLPQGWMDDEIRQPISSELVPLHQPRLSKAAATVGRNWERIGEPTKAQLARLIETLAEEPKTRKGRSRKSSEPKNSAAR